MKDKWDVLLENEPSLKYATNVRVTQGKGCIAGSVLIPGPMMIEFDLPEGVEPPGQGVIISVPGEEPRFERVKGKIRVATKTEDGFRQPDKHSNPVVRDIKPVANWPKRKDT